MVLSIQAFLRIFIFFRSGALLGTMVSTMQKMRNNDVADVHKLNIFSGVSLFSNLLQMLV